MSKILIVDDQPELKEQLEWAVRGPGREVLSAESEEQAVQFIQGHALDVIVTDLKMETPDAGLAVLQRAKENDIYTQVIVVTAYGTPEDGIRAMEMGAFDYLERNQPGTDFLAMVRSKVKLALEFREARLHREHGHEG